MNKHLKQWSIALLLASGMTGALASCESTATPNIPTNTTTISAQDRAIFVLNEGMASDGSLDVVIFHKVTTVHDSGSKKDSTIKVDTIVHKAVLNKLGLGNDI